jgi:hypothetical protein
MVLLPVIGVLAAAAIALGVVAAVASGGGGTTQQVVVSGCVPGRDEGCKPRVDSHEHADFLLSIDGTPFNFNQPQFVSEEGDEKSPIVHIHPPHYTVVHVHLSGTTWDEFFRSLGFELKDPTVPGVTADQSSLKLPDGTVLKAGNGKQWRFYVNGVKVDGVAFEEIHDLDRVLLSYGSESDDQVAREAASVSDEACILSERCKDRIDPNAPPEPCQGGQTCTK